MGIEEKREIRYFTFGLLVLYLLGCVILYLTLVFFKEWGLIARGANGVYFSVDGSNTDLIDFYNIFNVPRLTYLQLFKNYPAFTILFSLILSLAFLRLTSSRDKNETKDGGKEEKEEEGPLARPFGLDFIILDLPGANKKEVLGNIAGFTVSKGMVRDPRYLYETFMDKERLGSTGIGRGVALPEACFIDMAQEYLLILCRLKEPVDFDALDAEPVSILLVFLCREKNEISRLAPIRRLIEILGEEKYRKEFLAAKDERGVCRLLEEAGQG